MVIKVKYVQRDLAGGRLTADDIKTILEEFKADVFITNQAYYEGNNEYILHRESPDPNAPNNKVPIPYGRKIISTVTGYMYKPGSVTYSSENEAYLQTLTEVFDANREEIETSQLGLEASIHGVAYELHYTDSVEGPDKKPLAIPRFTKIPAEKVVPIYDYSIEPKLVAVLYHYLIGEVQHVFTYYADVVQHYTRENRDKGLVLVEEQPHFYGRVPWVVYLNNEERVGDFEPVKPLIDGYDVLMSDSLNEFDRFAWAYLLMKGFGLTDEDAQAIKWKRAFENIDVDGGVEFLTKEINSEFINFMSDWIRKEIHKQSHVPDFLETVSGSAQSGVAISKLLYDFEFICATKEAYFKAGLKDRIQLIDGVLRVRDGGKGLPEEVDIEMHRNKPMDMLENAQVFTAYSGHISEQTLIEQFAPFVKDAEEELARLKGEQEAQAQVDLDNFESQTKIAAEQKEPVDEE